MMLNLNVTNCNIEGLYYDENNIIVPYHNALTGAKNYVLASLEVLIGNLNRETKNDETIEFLSRSLVHFVENNNYIFIAKDILESTVKDNEKVNKLLEIIKDKFAMNELTEPEKIVLKNIVSMNVNEYMWKSDFDICDYSAMYTLTYLCYQIMNQGLNKYISNIKIFVDTYGELSSWEYEISEEKIDCIPIDWNSLDKIDHYESIYKTKCIELKEDSIYDLASVEATEEMFTNTERKKISFNMIVKQYCGVIEQEVNEIIQLYNLGDKPTKHLMWKDMKAYVKKNKIDFSFKCDYSLYEVLENLHPIRNISGHGGKITEEQYLVVRDYKERQLFEKISWTKLELKGKN